MNANSEPLRPQLRRRASGERGDRRALLGQLDACLRILEEAHERDEVLVSADLSKKLQAYTLMVAPGMRIAEAMDLVFEEQNRYLAAAPVTASSAVRLDRHFRTQEDRGAELRRLDETSARALTERIKHTAHTISLLLLEAYEGQAWLALGYRSWERYVRGEFDLSRPRSYELLDHGRLVRSVEEVTGASAVARIAPYTARRLKPHLAEFMSSLRRRALDASPEEMPAVVGEVIDAWLPSGPRSDAASSPRPALGPGPDGGHGSQQLLDQGAERGSRYGIDVAELRGAIDYLAAMPSASDVVDQVSREESDLGGVEGALRWLTEFASEWHARQSDS